MSLFRFLWLRRLIRRNTSPIPEERAQTWKQRLSIIYVLVAWNACGLVLWAVYNGRGDWARDRKPKEYLNMTPAQQWAQTLGINQAKVVRVSGTNISSYTIDEENEKADDKPIVSPQIADHSVPL